MLLPLTILFGLTPNWKIYETNNDTIVEYKFTKESLKDLRLYINKLEMINELYNTCGDKLEGVQKSNDILKSIIDKKDEEILDSNLKNYNLTILNKELSAKITKQNKAIPYYLGGGFLGGLLLCLIVK